MGTVNNSKVVRDRQLEEYYLIMSQEFAGNYTFISQNNFEEYLKAADINIVKRKLFASTKPSIVIEVNGKKFKVQTVMPKRTMTAEFTLDEPYENDMKGEKETYLTTLDGNKLVTKVVSSGNVITTREFNGSEMVQTYFAKNGASGTRTFSKA